MKQLYLLLALAAPLTTMAATESQFKRCVEIKDLTVAIAEQADRGRNRVSVKEALALPAANSLVDWVYDFRGAFTTQQMAQKQMDLCIQELNSTNKRK